MPVDWHQLQIEVEALAVLVRPHGADLCPACFAIAFAVLFDVEGDVGRGFAGGASF
jgi:hypothetical protein